MPGWNDYVGEAHSEARDAYLMWHNHNKPRQGPMFDLMKKSRARFKRCLRQCRRAEDKAKADSLARKLILKDDKNFWKDIKKAHQGSNSILATSIDGTSGNHEICKLWENHYSTLLNSNDDESQNSFVLHAISSKQAKSEFLSTLEVREAISELKPGESLEN